jgi:hypothetical protein
MIEVFNTSNKEGHGILGQAINIPNIPDHKSLNEKKNVLRQQQQQQQQRQQQNNEQSTTTIVSSTNSGARKLSTTVSNGLRDMKEQRQQTVSLPSCKENGCVILYIHIPKTGKWYSYFLTITVPSFPPTYCELNILSKYTIFLLVLNQADQPSMKLSKETSM